MGRKGKSKQAKQAQKGQTLSQGIEEEYKKAPHSFIFNRGQVGKNVTELISDMRRVMEPYTAEKLQTRKRNVLKDFVSVAGLLNVTHFVIFTKTDQGVYMKLCRLPRGPTLTFQVMEYTLARDIISSLKRHHTDSKQFLHHPLLVMNSFSGEGMHMKLMATMIQNMFPSINVTKVKLGNIRRTALFSYDPETDTVEFRHYNVRTVALGASRGVKKILKAKVPNLAGLDDFSEYLTKGCDLSESEAELDGEHNTVTIAQETANRGSAEQGKSAIRLSELGPRLRLKLVKIEEGMCEGDVLHHGLVQKTAEQLAAIKEERMRKKQEKAERKRLQEINLAKKEQEKEVNKKRTLAGMKRKAEEQEAEEDDDDGDLGIPETKDVDDMDDAEWYEKEVGVKPDPELFPKKSVRLKRLDGSGKKDAAPAKKRKLEDKPGKYSKDGKHGKDGKDSDGKKEKKPLTQLDKIKRRKLRASGVTKRTKRGVGLRKGPKKEKGSTGEGEGQDNRQDGGFKRGRKSANDGKKTGFGGKAGHGGKKPGFGGKGAQGGKKPGFSGKSFKGKKAGGNRKR